MRDSTSHQGAAPAPDNTEHGGPPPPHAVELDEAALLRIERARRDLERAHKAYRDSREPRDGETLAEFEARCAARNTEPDPPELILTWRSEIDLRRREALQQLDAVRRSRETRARKLSLVHDISSDLKALHAELALGRERHGDARPDEIARLTSALQDLNLRADRASAQMLRTYNDQGDDAVPPSCSDDGAPHMGSRDQIRRNTVAHQTAGPPPALPDDLTPAPEEVSQ
jgi:hypothetical protein